MKRSALWQKPEGGKRSDEEVGFSALSRRCDYEHLVRTRAFQFATFAAVSTDCKEIGCIRLEPVNSSRRSLDRLAFFIGA
jgi:hypothetical protein